MEVSLEYFEQVVEEVILDRGFSYYSDGAVVAFELISDNEYEASVLGTEEYTVFLKVEDDVVVKFSCDCPYDMGPVCKHVVASLYYLKENKLYFNNKDEAYQSKDIRKSVVQQYKDVLDKVSHRELKIFIEEQCKKDNQFRNLFLSSFAHHSENETREFYLNQIESIVDLASDRHGFIGWHQIQHLVQGIDPLILLAQKHFEAKRFNNAFYISTVLMEEMTKVIENCDDSSGFVGGIINVACEMLNDIALEELPNDLRNEFLNYCVSVFDRKIFEGWDWHLKMLDIAIDLIDNKKEADVIIKCIDDINVESEKEYAQFLKYIAFSRFKSEDELDQFLVANISNSSIRNAEIDKAVRKEDYDRAIKLSKDGIAYNEKDRSGLTRKWYNWLLKIAQINNDSEKIIEYARYLLIDNFYREQDYYKIMKQQIEPDKWHYFLEEIIEEIASNQMWRSSELIRTIYINEEWWDRLFLLLKQNVSLHTIESNEQYLSEDYSQQLVQLYSQELIEFVELNVGRNHYQTACRYLRRMVKLGGIDETNRLIEFFKDKYPRRRALLDELSRVK